MRRRSSTRGSELFIVAMHTTHNILQYTGDTNGAHALPLSGVLAAGVQPQRRRAATATTTLAVARACS
jgi:hypothetical protein